MPIALFKGGATAAERPTAHGAPVAAGDRIDLHVDSTPIDLGLVQGFTTALTKVTGTLQAQDRRHRLRRRSASDRRRSPSRRRRSPSSRPASPTPTCRARSICSRTRCTSTTSRVLDNHQSALSITGDLAIHELRGRRRRAVRQRRRLQGHRQQDGQRPDQHQPRDRRRAAGAADRRRPRRVDRPGRSRSRSSR